MQKIILTIAVLCVNAANAQWQQTNGPHNGNITCMAVNGANVFAGTTDYGRVFYSANSGGAWSEAGYGIPAVIRSLAVSGNTVFAGTYGGGVYLSTSNGTTWTAANNGLNTPGPAVVAINGASIIAGNFGIYLSGNNGSSWTPINNGFPMTSYVTAFAFNGANIFVGTHGDGIFLSANNGGNWTRMNSGLTDTTIQSLAVSGTTIFAGTYHGIFSSTNNGGAWTAVNNGIPVNPDITSLAVSGTTLFAGTGINGVYLSNNNGITWTRAGTGMPADANVTSLAVSGSNIFAGTSDPAGYDSHGVYLSTDNGSTWTPVGLRTTRVCSFAAKNNTLFAGTEDYSKVYASADAGNSWTDADSSLPDKLHVYAMAFSGNNLFAATGTQAGAPVTGIYLSTDYGKSWSAVNNGLPATTATDVYALAMSGSNIIAGAYHGIYLSANNGASWTAMNNGFPQYTTVNALAVNGTSVFAGTDAGVFLSTNNASSWTALNSGLPANPVVTALGVNGGTLFAGIYAPGGGLYFSTDNGSSWTAANNGLTDTTIHALAFSGSYVFVGTNKGIFYTSYPVGGWVAANSGLPANTVVSSLMVNGANIYAGTGGSGVWKRPLSQMVTDVRDLSPQNALTLFPNPFSETATFRAGGTLENATVTIYNSSGIAVRHTENVSGKTFNIFREGMARGLYIVVVTQDNKPSVCGRFVIAD
jgi:hypothetical protein